MNSLVSIALATYNGEKFLEKQLDSIINQTYRNLEIVIVDDFSTDNTIKILEKFKKLDGRIRLYINDKNLGFLKNFEKAISLCNGEFIALCDQDDIWEHNKIELLINEIGHFSLIHSDAFVIDENDNLIGDSLTKMMNKKININIIDFVDPYKEKNIVTGCTSMFRADLKDKILPIPLEIKFHDYWLFLVSLCEKGVKYIPIRTIKYRYHSNNIVGIKPKPKKELNHSWNKYIRKKIICKLFLENIDKFNLTESDKRFLLDSYRAYKHCTENLFAYRYSYFLIKYRKTLRPTSNLISILFSALSNLFNLRLLKHLKF